MLVGATSWVDISACLGSREVETINRLLPLLLRVSRLSGESELIRDHACCTLNHICNFLGVRNEDAMACTWDLCRVAVGSLGIEPFEFRVDRSVRSGDNHPTWFVSPCGPSDDPLEIHSCIEYLGARHESRQVFNAAVNFQGVITRAAWR